MNPNTYEKLGNYRLIQRLGRGGFSTVYLGEHLHLKTPVAIKILHSRLFNEEQLAAFLNEARTIAQLDHPHIVRMLDFGVEEHAPYLVFQYAPNGTVRQRYPQGSHIALPIIIQYVRQIAEALQYAHELKLIHRDIKPDNFLLGQDDEILLGDFGLAIPSQSLVGQLDHDRAGTAEYMAPEQSLGKSSRASDQYALGVVVYEWLCGHPPFIKGTDHEILHQHIHDTPIPLHELVPTVPPAIEQVVMRALAKKPSERFPHIQDFAHALAAAYYGSLAQQANAAVAPPLSPELDASSQDRAQPQSPNEAALATAPRDDPDGVQSPSSVSPDEQTGIDHNAPTRELAAVVHPAMQKWRMSRRSMVAVGILGLAALGGGAAAARYLLDSPTSPLSLNISSRPRIAPTSATAKSPAGGTSNVGGVDPHGTSSPSPTTGAKAPKAPAPKAPAPTTMAPLMLQISNAGALAQVRFNSNNNVVVATNQPGVPAAVLQVTYSDGTVQTFVPQTIDGNGNATFVWHARPNSNPGQLASLSATLVASATGANGKTVSSARVNVQIILPGDNQQ